MCAAVGVDVVEADGDGAEPGSDSASEDGGPVSRVAVIRMNYGGSDGGAANSNLHPQTAAARAARSKRWGSRCDRLMTPPVFTGMLSRPAFAEPCRRHAAAIKCQHFSIQEAATALNSRK